MLAARLKAPSRIVNSSGANRVLASHRSRYLFRRRANRCACRVDPVPGLRLPAPSRRRAHPEPRRPTPWLRQPPRLEDRPASVRSPTGPLGSTALPVEQ